MSETVHDKSKAPCRFETRNAAGKLVYTVPAVDCGVDCLNCGWNPAERNRRWEHGTFEEVDGIRKLRYPPREDCPVLREIVGWYLGRGR